MADYSQRPAKERERIRKVHEQTVGDQFVDWLAQRGGPGFSLIDRPEPHPDLVHRSGDRTLNVVHTSAQYDVDQRIFIDTPVLGSSCPLEVWPPYDFTERAEPKDLSQINEDLAASIVHQIEKKCRKARDSRFNKDPILLVEVLPGMTAAEDLARLLAQTQPPADCRFVSIYVVGVFPQAKISSGGYSTGGFRVIPIKHCDLTANLPTAEHPIIRSLKRRRARPTLSKDSKRQQSDSVTLNEPCFSGMA